MKLPKVLLLVLLVSCSAPKYVSTLESINYDDKTSLTTFSKLPFGTISIPGKWIKKNYNPTSGQQNFKNADSVFAAVAINRASGYSFYKPNMTSNQTAKAMYEWDAQYWTQQAHATTTLVKQDTTNHFIIWQILENAKYHVDNYYLFGCENGIIFTVMVDTEKWDSIQKISFLETVYQNKKVGTCCN